MATFKGTVNKNDLEGGFWELVADDGEHYQLRGGDERLRVQGQKVVIEGKVDEEAASFGMSGAILDVKSWKKG